MNAALQRLVDAARGRVMTPEQLTEQRVSFAWGNAPREHVGTIADMRAVDQALQARACSSRCEKCGRGGARSCWYVDCPRQES